MLQLEWDDLQTLNALAALTYFFIWLFGIALKNVCEV
jgi:hypothetical protein